jgi:hypothetical protein
MSLYSSSYVYDKYSTGACGTAWPQSLVMEQFAGDQDQNRTRSNADCLRLKLISPIYNQI